MSERNQRRQSEQAQLTPKTAETPKDPLTHQGSDEYTPAPGKDLRPGRGSYSPLSLVLLTALVLACTLLLWQQGVFRVFADLSAGSVSSPEVRLPIYRTTETKRSEPATTEHESPPLSVTDAAVSATNSTAGNVNPAASYAVLVGPFLSSRQLEIAVDALHALGFSTETRAGRGPVAMVRLLEGIYPAKEAKERLAKLRSTVDSAFILPAEEGMALYLGSFADPQRAATLQERLAGRGISARPVVAELIMKGQLLLALRSDLQTAQQGAERIRRAGYRIQIVPLAQLSP